MPPLAALGILLERGNGHLAAGAFLLFATNLFGIILAASLVLSARRVTAHRTISWRGRAVVLIPLATAVAVAYPLARQSTTAYRNARDEALVRSVLVPPLRAQNLGIQALKVVEQHDGIVASLDVAGPQPVSDPPNLTLALAGRLHRHTTLILRWTQRTEVTAVADP